MRNFFKSLLPFFAGLVIMASCIPNKRLVYFQHKPEPKRGEINNKDTSSTRVYTTHYQEYQLKPKDIITVRVASVTPSEYDFVQKYEEQLGLIRKLNQFDQGMMGQQQGQIVGGGGTQAGGMSSIALDRIQSGFILDQQGDLELPYIGKLNLTGLTIAQTESLIREKLKGYFETPVVRVQLLNFHFTILGEVNKEGRYTVYDPNASIIDAISLAGNLNDFADRSKIKIVRFQGEKVEVLYVNTLDEDLLGQPGFYLQPNDMLIIPPLPARAARKYTLPTSTTAISLISSTLTLVLFLLTVNK